jgi:hypothetical protein
MKPLRDTSVLLLFLLISCFACSVQTKKTVEIDTNGFLSDECYQAILIFEPDDGAFGLVARRDSAYLKAKKADLTGITIEKMLHFTLTNQPRFISADKYKMDKIFAEMTSYAVPELKGFIKNGSIAFVYYNEKNSIIIGYQITKPGLKQKLNSLIDSLTAKAELNHSYQEYPHEKK